MEKVTPAQIFRMFVQNTKAVLPAGKKFNSKGKKVLPFARLDSMGIKNYTRLHAEYKLVNKKLSKRSSAEREAIVKAFEQIKNYAK